MPRLDLRALSCAVLVAVWAVVGAMVGSLSAVAGAILGVKNCSEKADTKLNSHDSNFKDSKK